MAQTVKIYTLTPNPSLDLSGHVPRITANEKNYATRAHQDPGGNGINAARIATRLNQRTSIPVIALGFLGGEIGKQISVFLKNEGVRHRFTAIKGNSRINVTVTNDDDHQQTRLSFPGPKIETNEIKSLISTIKRLKSPGLLILGGSLPQGCKRNFYSDLIDAGTQVGLGVIADLPAKHLKDAIRSKSRKLLLIKPNLDELTTLVGKPLRTDQEISKAALKLNKKSAIVCVSLAERGAIVALNGRTWFVHAPLIKAKGTIGAGDSMVGAMATRLAHWKITSPAQIDDLNEPMLSKILNDVFIWGVAAGAATAMTEGTHLAEARAIAKLTKKVRVSQNVLRKTGY